MGLDGANVLFTGSDLVDGINLKDGDETEWEV